MGEKRALPRRRIRENAHYANRGRRPLFEIAEAGDVVCARDGRPVTDPHQTLAEKFYWMEVGFGGSGLAHDEQGEAFYTLEGGLALSRTYVHLGQLDGRSLMGGCGTVWPTTHSGCPDMLGRV